MKKRVLLLFCLIIAFCLSGCGYIKLTEKERNSIAEYMAGKILEYDRYYDGSLIKEMPEETPLPEETKKPEETNKPEQTAQPEEENPRETEKPDEPSVSADLNSVFKQKGIKLTYRGFKECSSYPENAGEQYFVVDAGLGKQLVVMEFNLENTEDSDISLSLLESALEYRLILDGDNALKPLKSWLTDDLQFIECKIPAGKTAKAHLVFEVEDGFKKDNARFAIIDGEKRAELTNVLK